MFDAIRTDLNEKIIVKKKKCIGIKEMRKEVPRWSYKLIDELEQLEVKNEEEKYGIRSRKAKRVVILTFTKKKKITILIDILEILIILIKTGNWL